MSGFLAYLVRRHWPFDRRHRARRRSDAAPVQGRYHHRNQVRRRVDWNTDQSGMREDAD